VVDSARTGVDWMLRGRFGGPLLALLGICAAILVIATLNLAGLLVARTVARQKEISIRLAIGASRWRVLRPLAFESLLLALAGTAGGILVAAWTARGIASAASDMFSNFRIDTTLGAHGWTVVAAATVSIALLLAVIPAWQARGIRLGTRGVIGERATAQKALIAIQVAFTLALVTASGVFASSFANLDRLPMGLHPEGLVEAMISPLPGGYNRTDTKSYYSRLLDRVSTIPGIHSAALSSFALYWHALTPEPVRTADGNRETRAETIRVSDGYFAALGVSLRSGEDFGRDHAEPEAIVSESVARTLGGTSHILVGDKRYRVIGVAPTIRLGMADTGDPNSPAVYLNFWQSPGEQRYPVLFLKGAADFKTVAAAVQSLGREYVEEYRSLLAQRDESIVEDRLLAYLSTAFGALALVLAAAGLFAILSCYVTRRTNEIGVRMALGATAAQIRRLVVAQITPLLAMGVAAGLALAFASGRLVSSFVFHATPQDPVLLTVAVLALAVTALIAAWIPARRATAIEPLDALRRD